MTTNVTFSTLNSLGDISFIGGAHYTLKFTCVDQTGSGIDLSTATCSWKLAPYGTDYAIVSKAGSVITINSFEILLTPNDTVNLSGKYSHQPIVTFSNGVTVIPAQGTITILKGLQT